MTIVRTVSWVGLAALGAVIGRRNARSAVFAATLSAGGLIEAGYAQTNEPAPGDEMSTLRVGYTEFRPYSFTDGLGTAQGYSIDLIRHLAESQGYALEFVPGGNPGRVLDLLAQGAIDVTTLLAQTPGRQEIGAYTAAVGTLTVDLMVASDSPYQSPADLAGRQVAVTAGSAGVPAAALIDGAIVVEFQRNAELLIALLSGEVDGVVAPRETFLASARAAGVEDRLRVLGDALLERPRGFMVRFDRPEVLADLNQAIDTVLTEELLQRTHERWFGAPYSIFNDPKLAWYIAGAMLLAACVAFAGGWAWLARQRGRIAAREAKANAELIDALDSIDLAVILFDRDKRATRWSSAIQRNAPKLVPVLEAGASMRDVIIAARTNGSVVPAVTMEKATQYADEVVATVDAGEVASRTAQLADGRFFEARDFRISDDIYASVRTDITQLERQAAEIRLKNDQLTHAVQQLEGFCSVAAHDIRAPLRSQKALIDWIKEELSPFEGTTPKPVFDCLSNLDMLSDRLSALVDDLLTYARADTLNAQVEAFDPATRLPNILAMSGIPDAFDVSIADDLPPIAVNPTAFDIVVRNLLSNAVRHHDEKAGRIALRGRIEDGVAVFEIEDDGPGIPEEFRDQVFEPFKKLKTRQEGGGSGLGLAFVRRTVEGWGGRVLVTCPQARGSVFRFTAPAPSASEIEPPAATAEDRAA